MDNYYNTKKFKDVLAKCENYLNDNSSEIPDSDEFADVAQYCHLAGDDEKAMKVINAALEIYPGSVAPLAFRSRYALLEEGDPDKADDIADEIADKHDPDYILLKAEIMIADGDIEGADEFLENAYEEYYDDEYYDDMPLDVAMLYSDYDEFDYAEKWLQRSDETDEDGYMATKARILMADGNYDESQRIIDDLINHNPYSSEYWDMMAICQMLKGDLHEALTSSDYALAIDPDDREAIVNKANGLLELENFKGAEKLFRNYAKLEPNKDSGFVMTAVAMVGQGRYQEALQWFKKALRVNKKGNMQVWQNRVEILFQMSFIENYLEHFGKVHEYLDEIADLLNDNLGYDMDELGQRLAEVDWAHGHVCLENDEIEKAMDWFDQALVESNNNPKVYIKIGISAFECGYVNYAYKVLHGLLYEQGFESEFGYYYLARCCEQMGKADEQKWAEERAGKNITSQEK